MLINFYVFLMQTMAVTPHDKVLERVFAMDDKDLKDCFNHNALCGRKGQR